MRTDVARAGFILVGGRSSRMGRDKALLPLNGSTLVEVLAGHLKNAAGTVTLIGPPDRYGSLGFPVVADSIDNCGPLGGVYTALSITRAEWNLIVACDMPGLTTGFLEDLFLAAEATEADCVVPEGARGVEPLCAVYHRRCRTHAASAIARKKLKMHDFVSSLHAVTLPVSDFSPLRNANTPEEWANR
ncbi:MAG: molybdenum cofactor guanylyltransferase [Bryobacteraceae bacterium]|jgi:molybdopterin-guanine dinucleotide biosynthesis protein A